MGVLLDEAVTKRIYEDATGTLTRKHGLDCAWFGERIEDDAMIVGYRSGAVSEFSDKTLLRPGCGLGGLVFKTNQVQSVDSYTSSPEITHDYDEKINAEKLKRVVGAPVWAGGDFFGVIMAGSRDGATYGSRASSVMENLAQRISDALEAAILRERLAALVAAAAETEARIFALEAKSTTAFGGIRTRERDVLKRVALGQTNREIAIQMQLSECTVKSYLRNVMQRFGVRNRTEAIAYARKAGLI